MDKAAEREARRRDARGQHPTRQWNPAPNVLGMKGEVALADFHGGKPDLSERRRGDKGIDLEVLLNVIGTPAWYEEDVKTARSAPYLLVDTHSIWPRPRDRIYILAEERGDYAELLGWEWWHEMQKCPTQFWSGNVALVHYKAREQLCKMEELKEYYCLRWRHHGKPAQTARYPERPKVTAANPFIGRCACGAPGLYFAFGEWACDQHRQY